MGVGSRVFFVVAAAAATVAAVLSRSFISLCLIGIIFQIFLRRDDDTENGKDKQSIYRNNYTFYPKTWKKHMRIYMKENMFSTVLDLLKNPVDRNSFNNCILSFQSTPRKSFGCKSFHLSTPGIRPTLNLEQSIYNFRESRVNSQQQHGLWLDCKYVRWPGAILVAKPFYNCHQHSWEGLRQRVMLLITDVYSGIQVFGKSQYSKLSTFFLIRKSREFTDFLICK